MYYYLLLIIPIIILIYVISKKQKKNDQELIDRTYEKLKTYGTFDENTQELSIANQTFKILFFKVPKDAEIMINSPKIWEIRTSYNQKLINQTTFLAGDLKKIVLIYPEVQPIKRYINENEMVFAKHTFFHNMYVIPLHDLDHLIKEVIL